MTQDKTTPIANGSDAMCDRLDKVKAARGRLMPNHIVLAIEFPAMLDTYEALYAATTTTFNALAPRDKKFILLTVVASAGISLGAHHVRDFLGAGGTPEQVRAAMRLALLTNGTRALDAVGPSWNPVVPGMTYDELVTDEVIAFAPASGIDAGVVELALLCGHATQRGWDKVSVHIVRAKHHGVSDTALAEALTTMILPAGNPLFVQAAGVWHALIAEGKVEAGPAYKHAIAVSTT
jgi:alkylhydroperoxidase/carboxymuconolactone decarboxylase family protein YurZ